MKHQECRLTGVEIHQCLNQNLVASFMSFSAKTYGQPTAATTAGRNSAFFKPAIQTKLKNDRPFFSADHSSGMIQRKCGHCEEEERKSSQLPDIQRQAANENSNPFLDILDSAGTAIGNVIGDIGDTIIDATKAVGDVIQTNICDIGAQSVNPVTNPMWDISTFQSAGASGWFGAKFGCYRNNCGRRHHGWDIHAPVGSTVMAVVSGNARHHNDSGGYGHYMDLASDADPDLVYRYAHLSAWQPNGHYCPGDYIGQTGVTGNADASRPHLHLQVIGNGTAVDPIGYFTEPSYVIEQTGTAATVINKGDPEPCAPC